MRDLLKIESFDLILIGVIYEILCFIFLRICFDLASCVFEGGFVGWGSFWFWFIELMWVKFVFFFVDILIWWVEGVIIFFFRLN